MQLFALRASRARRRALAIGLAASVAATLVATTGLPGASGAQITTPTDGAVIRDAGPVTIHESRGGHYLNDNAANPDVFLLFGWVSRGCTDAAPHRPKASATITVT